MADMKQDYGEDSLDALSPHPMAGLGFWQRQSRRLHAPSFSDIKLSVLSPEDAQLMS